MRFNVSSGAVETRSAIVVNFRMEPTNLRRLEPIPIVRLPERELALLIAVFTLGADISNDTIVGSASKMFVRSARAHALLS